MAGTEAENLFIGTWDVPGDLTNEPLGKIEIYGIEVEGDGRIRVSFRWLSGRQKGEHRSVVSPPGEFWSVTNGRPSELIIEEEVYP